MSILRWSKDMIFVDLPGEVSKCGELQTVIRMLREGGAYDVVVDFSHVHVVGGAWLARLREIQRLANECGRRLTLCSVAPAMRGIFSIAHLDDRFEFAGDRFAALVMRDHGRRPRRPAGSLSVPARSESGGPGPSRGRLLSRYA
jgi:anti-anti-sigma regulatory factor